MRNIIKIVIPVGIILVLIFPFWGGGISDYIIQYSSTQYLENVPVVDVTGTLYNWQPVDGLSYSILIDHEVEGIETGSKIYLSGSKIYSHIGGEIIQVHGKFIENYIEYKKSAGMGIYGGDGDFPVIFVDGVTVIKSPGESIQLTGIVHYNKTEESDVFTLEPVPDELYKLEKTGRMKVVLEDSPYNLGVGIDSQFVRHFDGKEISVEGYIKISNGEYDIDPYSNLPIIAVKYAKPYST